MSGLPYECNETQIEEFFESPASITRINLPKYQDSGRCLGYGHVDFKNKSEYEAGLLKNRESIGGRYIDISAAKGEQTPISKLIIGHGTKQIVKPKDPPDYCKTIYVGNLPYDATEDELGNKFRRYGKIEQIRFAYNFRNKQFKGFAYIDFEHASAVPQALNLSGTNFRGRNMTIDFSTDQARAGYKMNMNDDGNEIYNKNMKKKIVRDKKRKEKEREKHQSGLDYHE
jgi:RNA recognition motif-containing protein